MLYPLDADLVARKLGLAPPPRSGSGGGGRLTDLLSETEDDVSLMAYLRCVGPQSVGITPAASIASRVWMGGVGCPHNDLL